MLALLVAAALSADSVLSPPTVPSGCFDGSELDSRPELLAELNRRRAAAASAPIDLSSPLCAVAEVRAVAMAARGDLTPEVDGIRELGRQTLRAGYRSARLFEATVQERATPGATWDALAREHPEIGVEAFSGDLADLGLGRAVFLGKPIVLVLLALPSSIPLARQLAPFADLEAMRQAVLAATNRARAAEGRAPLVRDATLDRVAQAHAEAMLREHFYDHLDRDGRDVRSRLLALGYRAPTVGENLARGLFAPAEVVDRWLLSSGHRRNILSALFRAIGIGIAHDPRGSEQSVHWVQAFSSLPASSAGSGP